MAKKIPPPTIKSFVNNGTVTITTIEVNGKITSFNVIKNGEEKKFPVSNFNILDAWKQVEVYLSDVR